MRDKGYSLLNALQRHYLIAADPQHVKLIEPALVDGRDTVALGELFHIAINGHQDGIVHDSRSAHEVVWRARRNGFMMKNNPVSGRAKGHAEPNWRALVQQKRQWLGAFLLQAASTNSRAASISEAFNVGYCSIICATEYPALENALIALTGIRVPAITGWLRATFRARSI